MFDDATIKAMVERKIYWCPTLTVSEFVAGPRSVTNPIWSDLLDATRDSFRRAHKAGVPIVLGTDAGGFDWDKINQAEELRRYVDLGMTPWQALATATVNAAAMLGQAGTLGVIAPGARADIVALSDDPLDGHHRHRARLVRHEGRRGRAPALARGVSSVLPEGARPCPPPRATSAGTTCRRRRSTPCSTGGSSPASG